MIKYLTFDEVLAMHDAFIERFGGLKGIRDVNLLLSAIDTPKAAVFGEELYPTVYDKAAAYYSISCKIIPLMMSAYFVKRRSI